MIKRIASSNTYESDEELHMAYFVGIVLSLGVALRNPEIQFSVDFQF